MNRATVKKHIDILKAYANGADIQFRSSSSMKWIDGDTFQFFAENEYRVKPQPLERYFVVSNNTLHFGYDTQERAQEVAGLGDRYNVVRMVEVPL